MKQALLHKFIQSQGFIASCAWAVTASTHYVIHHKPLSLLEGLFVFSITRAAYAWYYIANPNFPKVKITALIYTVLAFMLYAYLRFPKPLFLLSISASSLLYLIHIKQKQSGKLLGRFLLLSSIWTVFPFFISLNPSHVQLADAYFFAYRFFFMANLCFIFLLKDEEAYLNANTSQIIKNSLLFGQLTSSCALIYTGHTMLGLALCLLLILTVNAYRLHAKPTRSPNVYSVYVDGLMLVESVLVHLAVWLSLHI